MKHSVLVTRRWPAAVEEKLAEHFEVTLNTDDAPCSATRLKQALYKFDAILPTVTDNFGSEVFNGLSPDDVKTRFLGNYGVGFNHISLEHAKRLGLTVTNTPDVLSECTADIAIMLLLMVSRRAGEGERELRAGQWTGWRPTHLVGHKVSGKTLGIVGFGRIGRETARRAKGFNMKIQVHSRSRVPTELLNEFGATQVDSLQQLASGCDFISLHCPGGADNTRMINQEFLSLMKPGGFLINTARGEIVDEAALIDALGSGQLAGAGLDVFDGEPDINPELINLDNTVLLPHLGSATDETRNGMGFRVLENLVEFFKGNEPPDRVI